MDFLKKIMSGLWGIKIPWKYCENNEEKTPMTPLMLNFHAFKTVLVGLVLCFEMDRSLPAAISTFIWYFTAHIVTTGMDPVQLFAWRIIGAVCFVFGQPSGIIPFALMIVLAGKEHECAPPPWMWNYVVRFFESTRCVDSWLTVGNNSKGFFEIQTMFFEDIVGLIRLYVNSTSLVPRIFPTYLRPLGIANNVKEIGDAFIPIGECAEKTAEYRKWCRVVTFCGTCVLIGLIYSAPGALFTLILLAFFLHEKVGSNSEPGMQMSSLADGVYTLKKKWIGINLGTSIGVVYEGVMHGTYHGTANCDLVTAGRVYSPVHVDTERDHITWGGMPRFSRIRDGDEIIVNSEDDAGRASYRVPVSVQEDGSFSWPSATKPGESGSPVWAVRNEKLVLVGLAGNWVSYNGLKSEYVKGTETEAGDIPRRIPGHITRICRHPGYGKTRRIIASLVTEEIEKRRAKILVIGPTKVVCTELYKALSASFPRRVCLDISDAPKEDRDAKVRIMAHATYVSRLLRDSPTVTGLTCLIVDEAHVDDAATACIREISQHLADTGVAVVQLSATFDDERDERSRHPISDIQMDEKQMLKAAVSGFVDHGRKSLIFVKGTRGPNGADALRAQIRRLCDGASEPRIIILSRKTFSQAMKDIAAGEYDIILSTNIAECGINLDIDDVYDSCMQFGYVEEDGDIIGCERKINMASRVQRRGRVGRTKPGRYYYASEPSNRDWTTSAMFDGRLLAGAITGGELRGRWAVSKGQAAKAVEIGISPRTATLVYGIGGESKSPTELRTSVTEWAEGDRERHTCVEGRPRCICKGKYEWFDDRDHDYLIRMVNGVNRLENKKNFSDI